ncbi:MAG: cold shock domain-containing protein, partial [Leptolyngbyaceae cyanobacterium RM1_406_9]|nr:cold shock domain-containing protein [Leptolyngbyaceae cyanobacterium RM1_406_9]
MKSVLNKGRLTTWKDDRGFGFIQPADGSQAIFLHISELKDSTRRPQVGDTIYYYAVTENGKLRAHKAFILGARRKPTWVHPTFA